MAVKKKGKKKAVKKTASKRGAKLKLNEKQQEKLMLMRTKGRHTVKAICERFKITSPTMYNYINNY
jgi:DNA invertase Pin-like site-specific DNA recombinase